MNDIIFSRIKPSAPTKLAAQFSGHQLWVHFIYAGRAEALRSPTFLTLIPCRASQSLSPTYKSSAPNHLLALGVPVDLLAGAVGQVRQVGGGDHLVAQLDRAVRLAAALAAVQPVL